MDLTGPHTDAEGRILAVARAEIDRLYQLAGLILGNAADAEDATQDALLRAWQSTSSLRDVSQVANWLDKILINVCRDRLRRRQTVRFIVLDDGEGRPSVDPFQVVLDRDQIVRGLGGLDAEQRIVVVLHYWAGLTLTEISARTGWPTGTVKSRLPNALERMRRHAGTPSTKGRPLDE